MNNHKSQLLEIAVIGAGAAGMMATLRSVLNNDQVHLFEGNGKDKKKSRAQWVRKIENIPGYFHYNKGISDPNKETLDFIENSPFKENLTFHKNTSITKIEKKNNHFILTTDKEEVLEFKYVILTTGVMDIQPVIESTIKPILPYANVQTVDYCIRCDGHHTLGKELSIIGKDQNAFWVAVMLHERYAPSNTTILTDGINVELDDHLSKLVEMYHFDVITNPLDGVLGDPKKGILEGYRLCNGEIVKTDFSFISLGMLVYNHLASSLGADLDARGFVKTNEKGETNITNLFVAGDLRANAKKQIYTAWDHAVDSADEINARIRKEKREKKLEVFLANR